MIKLKNPHLSVRHNDFDPILELKIIRKKEKSKK